MRSTIKVRLTSFWADSEALMGYVKRYGRGETSWKGLQFVTGKDYDRLVIFTRPHPKMEAYDPGKAVTFLTEPPASPNIRDHGTSVISDMYLPLPFYTADVKGAVLNGGNGKAIVKEKLLSVVTSDLNFMEGHFYRLRLVDMLDKLVEEGLDVWGKGYGNTFFDKIGCYRGGIEDKFDALWGYRYHFACENSFVRGYFTEKIVDPIVAETLCFYDGCLNLEEFIDERAFIRIDVKDPHGAVRKIIDAIGRNDYARRIRAVRSQKKRLLTRLNPLNIIWMQLTGKDVLNMCRL